MVRVGVIGTGFGARVVAPTYEAAGATVVDVVSARDDDAVHALCGRGDVDLVSVHSPPFLHVQHVQWACAAGHAVLCDKPFGRNAGEAEQLVAAADAAGVINLGNLEFRHEAARVQAKQLIDDGAIGAVEHVQWSVQNAGSRNPLRPYGWLFDRSLGGGWVGAWGAHGVDTVRWMFGEIVDAHARLTTAITERPDRDGILRACDADDGFTALLTVAGGATVTLDTS
ncbi:MAG TPA: Gfo/Idh/MocA family oxidoreductase, partial [Mycobacteriales bacterium]|nr:Gfo/Idh/MocA family oxidoreductase [Mycobacteriales bacterium]